MKKHYEKWVNAESKSGEWDWFYPSEDDGSRGDIRLVRFDEDGPIAEWKMTEEQFDDLSQLILKLNGK